MSLLNQTKKINHPSNPKIKNCNLPVHLDLGIKCKKVALLTRSEKIRRIIRELNVSTAIHLPSSFVNWMQSELVSGVSRRGRPR